MGRETESEREKERASINNIRNAEEYITDPADIKKAKEDIKNGTTL